MNCLDMQLLAVGLCKICMAEVQFLKAMELSSGSEILHRWIGKYPTHPGRSFQREANRELLNRKKAGVWQGLNNGLE